MAVMDLTKKEITETNEINDKKDKGILLESGTNELEIVEFGIGNSYFGVNVIKVREIINLMHTVMMPDSNQALEGIIKLRGDILPVIDLGFVLGLPASSNPEQDKLIVCEFNKMKMAFHVHTVSRIHRISWNQIEKPSTILHNAKETTIGVVKMDNRMILLLDYEKIIVDINPSSGINVLRLKELGSRERSEKRIVIAEDSRTIRALLQQTLHEAGYDNIVFYEDGHDAWEYLDNMRKEKKESFMDEIQLMITDIEMPKMDGHHLTKRIKEDDILKGLPVIIFSSLITDDLRHKGDSVGADAQVSKPEILELVKIIDSLIL